MATTRIAVAGCGFWSQFQIGGWTELKPAAEVVAVCDLDLAKAQARAAQFGIPKVFADPRRMFDEAEFDVLDVITSVETHAELVELAAARGKAVICQKPMAPDFATAQRMLETTRAAGVPFFVHENYRWQPQFRRVKALLDAGAIGRPFRARLEFNTAYPVFVNQPFLAELEQFAITDQGSHQFDILRMLFGEVRSLYCRTQQVTPGVKGEDVVTTVCEMRSGVIAVSEISFASRLEREAFPQSLLRVEGSEGSLRLDIGPEIHLTTKKGTVIEPVVPRRYTWQHPDYLVEPPSIVSCHENVLAALQGKGSAETTGADNFETVRLVFGAYESARTGAVIPL